MIWLVAGLVVFLGVHSVRMLAPGFRDRMIARLGEGAWKGLYSLISLAGLVLLIWGYGQARPDAAIIYEPPVWTRHIAMLLMLFSFILLVASQIPAGYIKKAVKHPMVLAVKIWAFAHLLANGDLASLILFLAFLAWAGLEPDRGETARQPGIREGVGPQRLHRGDGRNRADGVVHHAAACLADRRVADRLKPRCGIAPFFCRQNP